MGASTVTLQEFARRKVPIDELPHVISSDGAVHQSALMSYFLLAPMYGTYTKPTALKVQVHFTQSSIGDYSWVWCGRSAVF